MGRFGIIVDGRGEYNSLRTRFTGFCTILKTDGPRGHTAQIDHIVNGARKQIAMLKSCKCDAVVVLLDFENRVEDYSTYLNMIRKEFGRTYSGYKVHVAMPNRMIENWYLADIEHLSKNKAFLKKKLKQKKYEGLNGKDELKRCFAKGYSYDETTHGPQLFGILRFPVARQNSSSFNDFLFLIKHK